MEVKQMATLRELAAELAELAQFADDQLYDEELLADTFEGLDMEFGDKLDAYADLAADIGGDIDALSAEIVRLENRRITLIKNKKRVLESVKNAMETARRDKVKTTLHSFSIVRNGGKTPVVLDVDVDDLPDSLCRFKREADKDKIADYLAEGDEHVQRLAHFGERGRSLRIK
jgi:hypothetical protein